MLRRLKFVATDNSPVDCHFIHRGVIVAVVSRPPNEAAYGRFGEPNSSLLDYHILACGHCDLCLGEIESGHVDGLFQDSRDGLVGRIVNRNVPEVGF